MSTRFRIYFGPLLCDFVRDNNNFLEHNYLYCNATEIFTNLNFCFLPVQITWTDGYGKVIEDGTETSIEAMAAESKRFTTKSVLRFIPKMEHHNTSISCHAHNSAIDKKLQTKIHLNVKFAPKVSTPPNRMFIIYFNIIYI